jgi:hypothetical protein
MEIEHKARLSVLYITKLLEFNSNFCKEHNVVYQLKQFKVTARSINFGVLMDTVLNVTSKKGEK